MDGITYIENFASTPEELFIFLQENANWDTSMTARKTASYGRAYNYAQITYSFQEMLKPLNDLAKKIDQQIGFEPNNCLINYYTDGKSKMGFHSDQVDILEKNTGIVIISLGETRTLRFKNIAHKETVVDFNLPSGSLIYMTQDVQKQWLHAIPLSDTARGRMSLTFRKII